MRWVVLDRDMMMRVIHRYRWGKKATREQKRAATGLAVEALTSRLGPPAALDGALVIWDLKGEGLGVPSPGPDELASEAWTGGTWSAYEAELDARSTRLREK
jgi:hypothetical protein